MKRPLSSTVIAVILVLTAAALFERGFGGIGDWVMTRLMMIPGIIIALSFHEFGHAYSAYKCGDPTAKNLGRMTINPVAHIDAIGLASLLLIGFGWGKPVPVNSNNFKSPKRDELIVAVSGVVMNFIMAFIFAAILRVIMAVSPMFLMSSLGGIIKELFIYTIQINLVLLVFNLIPIPPLDGFVIFSEIFNLKHTKLYYTVYNNGFFILILLMLFNITGMILTPIVNWLYYFVMGIFF